MPGRSRPAGELCRGARALFAGRNRVGSRILRPLPHSRASLSCDRSSEMGTCDEGLDVQQESMDARTWRDRNEALMMWTHRAHWNRRCARLLLTGLQAYLKYLTRDVGSVHSWCDWCLAISGLKQALPKSITWTASRSASSAGIFHTLLSTRVFRPGPSCWAAYSSCSACSADRSASPRHLYQSGDPNDAFRPLRRTQSPNR